MRSFLGGAVTAMLLVYAGPSSGDDRSEVLSRLDRLHAASQPDSVELVAREHLRRAEALGDSTLVLQLELRRGRAAAAFGRGAKGIAPLERALRLAEAARDTTSAIPCVRWLGVARAQAGDIEGATQLYRELDSLCRATGDVMNAAWASVGLAWVANEEGRFDRSARLYDEAALRFRDAGDGRGFAWATNGAGVALRRGGRIEEAIEHYETALAVADSVGSRVIVGMARNNLGDIEYSLGDPQAALAHFEAARDLQVTAHQLHASIVAALNVAFCHRAMGRFDVAIAQVDSLISICERESLRGLEFKCRRHRAEIQLKARRPERAVGDLRSLLESVDRRSSAERWKLRLGISRALGSADSLESALRILAPGAEAEDPPRRIAQEIDLRRGWLLLEADRPTEAREILERVLDREEQAGQVSLSALAGLARAELRTGREDSAIVRLEQAATQWLAVRSIPLAPLWRERRGTIGRRIFPLLALLHAERGAVQKAFACVQTYKVRTLSERRWGPYRTVDDGVEDPSARLDAVRRALPEGELLAEMCIGPDEGILLCVDRDSVQWQRLPGIERVGRRLRSWRRLVSNPDVGGEAGAAAVRRVGRILARDLLAEQWPRILSAERVAWSADDALHLLSPSVLAWCEDPTDAPVFYEVPSGSFLEGLRAASPTPTSLAILAAEGSGPQGRRLRGARDEVEFLVDRYGADRWRPREEGRGTVPDLEDHDVLHLATHAVAYDQAPWNASLRFGGSGSGGELRAVEVLDMDLGARLVVLSSCSTAHGEMLSGEGIHGLATAFLAAGASCVVSTAWPIDDTIATRLVEDFYLGLERGEPVAVALARAQRKLREESPELGTFHWGGIRVTGDGNLVLPLKPES